VSAGPTQSNDPRAPRESDGEGSPAPAAEATASTRLSSPKPGAQPLSRGLGLLGLLAGVLAGSVPANAEDIAIPAELLGWTHEANARLRGGYKDNVLLSSFTPEASAFLGVGLEGFLSRTFDERWSLEMFIDGEERHYFSAEAVNNEQTAFALVQLQRKWADAWSFKGACEYLFQNQVVDVSATEPQFETMQVVGQAIVLRPAVRWTSAKCWWELQTPAQRQFYETPLDDSWQYGVKLQAGLPVDSTTEYSVSYEFSRNPFDTEPDREPNAVPIPGSQRVMDQHEGRFVWRQSWDEAHHWQTVFRLSVKAALDNATGYYDYVRGQVFLQLRYRQKNWEVSAEGRFGHYSYPVQTVSADDPTLRRRMEWLAGLHVERRLSERFAAVADYGFEQTRGNRVGDDYSANTVSAGLNFTF
jgi:hypothetical protein